MLRAIAGVGSVGYFILGGIYMKIVLRGMVYMIGYEDFDLEICWNTSIFSAYKVPRTGERVLLVSAIDSTITVSMWVRWQCCNLDVTTRRRDTPYLYFLLKQRPATQRTREDPLHTRCLLPDMLLESQRERQMN